MGSQLHLGVFLADRLEGVMQFGPSLDKRKVQGLVRDTAWNGFLELNRLAFSDRLPRNSESRAMAVAFRMIKKQYPHIEWIISFADGTQCGDGTIYRAAGFVLTSIRKNTTIWSNGEVTATNLTLRGQRNVSSMREFQDVGYKPLPGYQLRYIYFLNPAARERLTVPILPFSKIDEMHAGMYKGKARGKQAMAGDHPDQRRGSSDPHAPDTKAPQPGSAVPLPARQIRRRDKSRPSL